MKTALALLVACAVLTPSAFAQEDGEETPSSEAPIEGAAAPDSPRKPMTEAEKLDWYCEKHPEEGANCRSHARLLLPYISDYAKYEGVDTSGRKIEPPKAAPAGGSNGGAIGPLTGIGGPGAVGGKDIVLPYASWATAPHHYHYARILANYNATGPGTVMAFMFKAIGGEGIWSWVEDVNSTYNCTYKAWISATPNGPPLKGSYCEAQTTGSTGSYRAWASDPKRNRFGCPVKEGGVYWFNLKLVQWSPNEAANNVYSCIEHVTPQGSGAAAYFAGK